MSNTQEIIMGGNTYNRKHFTDFELAQLIKKINGFQSLFDNKVLISEKAWRANISRYLDADSANRFYFMIEESKGLPTCRSCLLQLTIESFSYSGDIKGFRKYCPECTKNGVWKLSANYNPLTLKERGNKIAKNKLEFYKSKEGKLTAKNNGKKISEALKKFHKTEAGVGARKKSSEYNSKLMRERILSGRFTPNSNNRNTHWDSEFNGKKYRSSWEALYHYWNPEAEYETLRIPYIYNGKEFIYIVDFIDHNNKNITEVKPAELLSDKKTKAKLSALKIWAEQKNYTVKIFNLESIKMLPEPNYELFNKSTIKKIRQIYENLKH